MRIMGKGRKLLFRIYFNNKYSFEKEFAKLNLASIFVSE